MKSERFTTERATETVREWIANGTLRHPIEDYSHVGTIWQEVGLRKGYRRVMAVFLTEQSAAQWLKNQSGARYLKASIHRLKQ